MNKVKVLLADSSVVTRMYISELVNSTGYSIVEKTASNGSIALEWLKQCEIDVLLLDVMIIKKEGIELVGSIKSILPSIEVIVMSNDQPDSPAITLESLKEGAIDFIQKPAEKNFEGCSFELKSHFSSLFYQMSIKKYTDNTGQNAFIAGNSSVSGKGRETYASKTQSLEKNNRGRALESTDLILIASSTGGPAALDSVLGTFSADIKKPVLIVQHMPPEFTNILAQTMNRKYHLNISEAKNGDIIEGGRVYIAPGGKHMTVRETEGGEKIIRLLDTAFVNGVKPSADVLFQSVAAAYKGNNILAVVLTGMGNDGTLGIAEIKRNCNCYCITQSENSCVVYGMPRCVSEAGLSDEAADLKDISARISQIVINKEGGRPNGK